MSRVLIVDDEPDIRMLIRLALERAGHSVIEASGGAEALELLMAEVPDVVVLDLRMPPPDGWSVLEALRRDGRIDELKVIAASAHASAGSMSRALDAGCVAYVKKPFRVEEIRAVVDSVAAGEPLNPTPD